VLPAVSATRRDRRPSQQVCRGFSTIVERRVRNLAPFPYSHIILGDGLRHLVEDFAMILLFYVPPEVDKLLSFHLR